MRSVTFTVLALVAVAACGTTDEASKETLPPIRTTTSTAITTTTLSEAERFYTIQSGETLQIIATRYGVTMQSIVELNAIENPDAIQAGQIIEIPAGGTPVVTNAPSTTGS